MKLLFFKAPWCTVCHAIENHVPQYAIHIDCSTDVETPTRYSICGLPMFVAVNEDGDEVARTQSSNVTMIDKWFGALTKENTT